ncbi:hypothetical protein D3C75_1109340 [compost metagenome]
MYSRMDVMLPASLTGPWPGTICCAFSCSSLSSASSQLRGSPSVNSGWFSVAMTSPAKTRPSAGRCSTESHSVWARPREMSRALLLEP